jgi:GT2 family glycosyltransferase
MSELFKKLRPIQPLEAAGEGLTTEAGGQVEVEPRQSALAGRNQEIVELKAEVARLSTERNFALAAAQAESIRLAELEARLTSERNSALAGFVAAKAECARLSEECVRLSDTRDALINARRSDRRDALRAQLLGEELATEVRKVLRQPWRPLAQRSLYFLFSALSAPVRGRIGEFFDRQAKQRTPGRLEALAREADSEKERLLALVAEDDRLSPVDDESPPADIERRILVADYRIPRPDVSAGEQATVRILEDLCALGYEVTFVPTDMRPAGRYEEDLRRLGVQVITHQSGHQAGHGGAAEFVEKFGRQFGVFYLIRLDVAEVVLPVARRVAPGARIISHLFDLHVLRERREGEYRQEESSHGCAAETYHREIAMMRASDHVVLVSTSEAHALRRSLLKTPISVFPGLSATVVGYPQTRASFLATLNEARALSLPAFIRYCQTKKPAEVPAPESDVDVSIIIPVYNKWELTRACITSILQTNIGTSIRFEVILADDNSADETVRAAELFPGLRVVRTPENLGFLRNCNHAARTARGRYLLFLNNDTVVLPGWLEALFHSMESDPTIGIAGSKLLYPDMAIQEAGGAVFQDASARNVGRGQERDNPLFNVARAVDYISGASILVRADFWKEVGGFDERFKVAYYEDTDLAMSARAKGLIVWYQPKSEVIHFEHQSYKDQEGAGPSDLMRHNGVLMLEKWKDVLLRDHAETNHDPWSVPPTARS